MKKSAQYRRIKKLGSGNFGDVILVESSTDKQVFLSFLYYLNLSSTTP